MAKLLGLLCAIIATINIAYAEDILLETINENSALIQLNRMSPRSVPIELEPFDLEDKLNLPKVSVYNNVISYHSQPFGNKWGRPTNVHETIHGINNSVSNIKDGYRAFYVGKGKAIWIKEPNITMGDIISYIPEPIRGYRFRLYFSIQRRTWDRVALYPMDEWTAYIGGAECAVEDHTYHGLDATKYQSGQYKIAQTKRTDEVSGSLEFAIYCTALAMCIKDKDKEYWNNYNEFKYAMKFFLVKAEQIFFTGKDIFPSEKQDILLEALRTHDQARPMRKFLIEEFDGVFIQ